MISEILLLVEQIRSRRPKIDDLWTTVAILLQPSAFEAILRVADALTAADDALVLVVAKAAFIADADLGGRPYVAVTDWALAVTLFAKATHGNAGLLSAHD